MITFLILLAIYCLVVWYLTAGTLFGGLNIPMSSKRTWLVVIVAPILVPLYMLFISVFPPKQKEAK